MRKRIKLLYVAVIAFVIIAGGLLTLNRLNADIVVLEDIAREDRLKLLQVNQEKSDLQQKIARRSDPDYLREIARKNGYLKRGEIKFVVVNPEALYDDYQAVQDVTVLQQSQEISGEEQP